MNEERDSMSAAADGAPDPALDVESLRAMPADAGGDVALETPLPPAEVAEVFAALDKAVRSQRLYQPNNPVYHSFIAAAKQTVAGLWDSLPELTVGVDEHAFRWYGRTFPAAEARESLPFLFYKDGIRFITMLPGFEDEIERFLQVVNQARMADQNSADDMVTLLWQAELTAFQYSYVDALAEGLQVPQSTVPKLRMVDTQQVQLDLKGDPADEQPPAVQEGQPPMTALISRDDFEETLYFLEPGELETLRHELELEWTRSLRRDVLNALFDRLEDNVPEWRTEIMHILRSMVPVYLGAGDLPSATQVLMELNTMLEQGGLEGEHRDEALTLFRELSEPATLQQLLRSLEDGSIDPAGAELGVFLKYLGPTAMPVLLLAMERTSLPALQKRLREAMEQLGSAHADELIALLSSPDELVVRGAARLAGQLALPAAAAPLAAMLDRPDPLLRRIIVDGLLRIRNAAAIDGILRALSDGDREVRIAAARGLAGLRYPPARGRLSELLESRMVRDADLTEKIAFFEAFGSVATPESVTMLDRMLNGRRLFGRESPEMRACAAMALGRVGSPAAVASLRRAASETNPIVRNAVAKALRQESAS